jgi:hypothetical protein
MVVNARRVRSPWGMVSLLATIFSAIIVGVVLVCAVSSNGKWHTGSFLCARPAHRPLRRASPHTTARVKL